MASDLERLALAVHQLGDKAGPVRGLVARSSLTATRASSSVPPGVPSAGRAAVALQAAGKSLAEASGLLDEFSKDAEAFAARLVGGTSTSPTGTGFAAPGHSAEAHPPGFPEAFGLIPLDQIDEAQPLPSDKDYPPEDLAWAIKAFADVIQPGVAKGMTLEDFRNLDTRLNQSGTRSYGKTYEGFFGGSSCIKLSRRPDGTFEIRNGFHRVAIARALGVSSLPAWVR